VHALRATPEQRRAVARALAATRPAHSDPAFFRVLDVARRIAWTGSLGLRRYSILIEGKGGRNGNVLLDLKQAAPSTLADSMRIRQPAWNSEAQRVVTIQRRVQAVPPALLHPVRMGRHSYILRELQPAEDRLALEGARDKRRRLETSLRSMAEVVAWDHLRSAGCHGSATNDEWVAFGHNTSWLQPLVDFSRQYADVVTEYWREFAKWWDEEQKRQPRDVTR
jgi:uncharacterized protein (DUF2252 family)